ncbi:hypothetical protein K469DRAFT_713458 [Zopfia rhizophila CBS 207.26]|uniref:Uncharacterized protein n=1 Tax=Zopfia rhizophila CBS 207.26 TaxID=1314779 RepID=A0A6A6DQK8_9PEZI|nr:hypothetical protein K469DRAFT_713458 [Zopfia rhizophila CBS 207.26]
MASCSILTLNDATLSNLLQTTHKSSNRLHNLQRRPFREQPFLCQLLLKSDKIFGLPMFLQCLLIFISDSNISLQDS